MMYYKLKQIDFDFTGAEDEITEDEMNQIVFDVKYQIWNAEDDDDLFEQITSWTGWCINSLDYEVLSK